MSVAATAAYIVSIGEFLLRVVVFSTFFEERDIVHAFCPNNRLIDLYIFRKKSTEFLKSNNSFIKLRKFCHFRIHAVVRLGMARDLRTGHILLELQFPGIEHRSTGLYRLSNETGPIRP